MIRARRLVCAAASAALVSLSADVGAQVDCSKRAERYAQLERMESDCIQSKVPVEKSKCEAVVRRTRAQLDAAYASCDGSSSAPSGGGAGSDAPTSGPITPGFGASPQMTEAAGQLNGLLNQLDKKRSEEQAEAAQRRAEEEAREERRQRREEAERAMREAKLQALLTALGTAFAMAPEPPPDPPPSTKAAREICRREGAFMRIVNPSRFVRLCAATPPAPPAPAEAAVDSAVPAPAATGLWDAATCTHYAAAVHDALAAVARQHEREQTACREAATADPPRWPRLTHDCTKHAAGMRAIHDAMTGLSRAALDAIDAEYAKPVAQRSGCTQHLVDVRTAADDVAFDADRLAGVLGDPVEPATTFPVTEDRCATNHGAYRDLSVASPSPSVEPVCRALAAYRQCR